MSLWKFGDFETEIDFTDADFLDRLENAQKKLKEEAEELPKTGRNSEIVRAQNACYDRFFDRILGQGASGKMFSSGSLSKRLDAADALKAFEDKQSEGFNSRMDQYLVNRRGNRAQRRDYQKKHGKRG